MSKLTVLAADDLYEDNDVYCLSRKTGTASSVAGICISAEPECWPGCMDELDQEVAEYAQRTLLPLLNRKAWLLLTTPWLQPTRITSYKRLWRCLGPELQASMSRFSLCPDIELTREREVSYAGIAEVAPQHFDQAIHVLRHSSGVLILSNQTDFGSADSVSRMHAVVYSSSIIEHSEDLASFFCPRGDVVVRLPVVYDHSPRPYASELLFFMPPEDLKHLRQKGIETD